MRAARDQGSRGGHCQRQGLATGEHGRVQPRCSAVLGGCSGGLMGARHLILPGVEAGCADSRQAWMRQCSMTESIGTETDRHMVRLTEW
ncbi:hypothetical protein APV28_0289 [Comamonas testosteroni]|nr:hypothetical protein APV28_0289 [Comamonas testosteroni]